MLLLLAGDQHVTLVLALFPRPVPERGHAIAVLLVVVPFTFVPVGEMGEKGERKNARISCGNNLNSKDNNNSIYLSPSLRSDIP